MAGTLYNAVENWRLAHLYPVPGRFYIVNGSPMHLYCTGTGTPTVIFESGLGDDWLIWQKVQPELARVTRVCSYDRAGLGWSDPQAGPRGARTIAEQLHALLQTANLAKPLLLVGHSSGGLYARGFAGTYSAEVIGLVLVEASSPEAFQVSTDRRTRDHLHAARHRKSPWFWLKDVTGWERLAGQCNGRTPAGLDEYADIARAAACRPSFVNSWLGEWDDFESLGDEVAKLPCCGTLPILVISRDPSMSDSDASSMVDSEIWASVQEGLKSLSTRSRRIIARNSGHYVMIDRPDVIINNVRLLIQELRGLEPHSKYATTVVQ